MPGQLSLDAIGLKPGTDKASTHRDYVGFYKTLYDPFRAESVSVLEIFADLWRAVAR